MDTPDTGAEMRALLDAQNWEGTAVGARSAWPKSLNSLVELVLGSSFPMFLLWGEERTLIYNDAYRPILGEHHPWALGARFFDVWPEARKEIEPVVERAYQGVGSHFENLGITLLRNGYPEEAWFTFSYSPVTDDEGAIRGALCVCVETTQAILKEKRRRFLSDLRERLRTISDTSAIIETAQEALGTHLKANRVGYGGVDATGRYFTTERNWTDGSIPNHNGTHDLSLFGQPVHEAIKRGETIAVHDVRADERTLPPEIVAAFSALEVGAGITVSLVKEMRLVAALYVHQKQARRWTEGQLRIVEEVAELTWSAVERGAVERQLRRSEDRYRRIFEQTSDLIITADLNQVITDCNPAAAEAVGLTRDQALGRSIAEFVSPEDFGQTSEMLRQKLMQGGTTKYDVRVRNGAGDWLYWEINSGLALGDDGMPIGLHVIGRDVTERKRAEDHQHLLINELNHRVKNTLAIVQSIAFQTLRNGGAPVEVQETFANRIAALSAAHDILTRESWSSASMREIIEHSLAPFCAPGRCQIEGRDLRINPRTTVSLALAVHELATNASKYGALSNEAGRLSVRWEEDGDRLRLAWREEGGPPVIKPTKRGFGTGMIERALAGEVQGTAVLRFEPSGLICDIEAPLSSFS